MTISFDNALGIHPQALSLRSQRAEMLAGNMANADTPNYKARDINFKDALAGATSELATRQTRTNARHLDASGSAGASVHTEFRVPLHPSVDGNTVDSHLEQAEFARNSIEFQAGFTFLNGKFKGLVNALRGE